MNKKLILLLAALLSVTVASAQKKHEVNFYIGGTPAIFNTLNVNDDYEYSYTLSSIYGAHTRMYTDIGVMTLDYTYTLKDWLKLGVETNFCRVVGTTSYRLGTRPDVSFTQSMYSMLPQAKFCIPSPEHFRLYGKVAAGLQLNAGEGYTGPAVQFAYDIVPIGVQWGGHFIYGTAEFCVGSIIMGGRIGVGINF